MKQNKLLKHLLVLLAVALLLPQAAAAYDFKVGSLCYNKNSDGTSVTVTYEYNSTEMSSGYLGLSGNLVIPATVTYSGKTYSVTSIGGAFRRCTNLISVTIPNSVTSIGGSSFYGCTRLTSVNIPNSVTSIGGSAFYNCTGLTSVTIPNSVTFIGGGAFYGCKGLTSITIPNSVTQIGFKAFYNCTGLTYISIGNGVTEFMTGTSASDVFGPLTFACNTGESLSPITLCWNVIGNNCNYNVIDPDFSIIWRTVSKLIIGPDVRSLPQRLLGDYSKITDLTWNAKNCSNRYTGLTGVESLTVGTEVQSLPAKCFASCTNLKTINWNAINCANFSSTLSDHPFTGLSTIESFSFGNQVQHIPAYLCYGLSDLYSFNLPNSLVSIGNYAFSGCSSVTSFDLPNSLITIGAYAFAGCQGISQIAIPSNVTTIGHKAFYNCNKLTTVNWNSQNCDDFTSSINPFTGLTNLNSINFGSQPTNVPAYICNGLTGLSNVNLGNSIQTIRNNAFSNCSSLRTINIPNNITTIGTESFKGSALTELSIPTSISLIETSAFSDCSQLEQMTIEGSVAAIKSNAFANTTSLNKINCLSAIPPQSVATTTFSGITPSSVTLEVPLAAVDAYSDHDIWKQFYIKPASGSTQGSGGFPGSGSGTEADPYLIFNPIQLYSVRNFTGYESVVFKLMQNVDMTEFLADNNPNQGWEPIGVQASPFKGVFYGENHKITGLSMSRTSNYNGLFGYTDGALINNLTIEGSTMTGGNYTGAVVGVAQSSYLTNVTANVNVGGKSYTGGFVGLSAETTLTNCHHTGTVTATDSISGGFAGNLKGILTTGSHHGNVSGKQQTGGFVGVASGTISDIVCEGTVTGTQYTGGFAGKNAANVTNVTASGNVTGTNYTGGYAGHTVNSTVTNYTRTGDILGSQYTGGFAGYNESDVNTASHNGTVKGTTYTGGFAGYTKSSDIEDFDHDGNITSTSGNYVGGFAGYATGSTMTSNFIKGKITTNNATYVGGFAGYAENCTVNDFQAQTGSVNGNTKVGGFAGEVRGLTATSCYAIGDVTASSSSLVSGFIAYNYGALSLTKCGTVSNVTVGQSSGISLTGGLVGQLTGNTTNNTISNCFAVGDIKTNGDRIGGIVGEATRAVNISNSYYSGSITGANSLGGIVGYGSAVTMSNNYANGSINGNSNVGGIAGYLTSSSSITSCVAAQDAINAVNGTIGRVYGLIEGNSTVGTPGTDSANRGMASMSVVSQGQQLTLEDGEQHGTSLGKGMLKWKSSYQGLGWDFSTDWTILETESFPYKPSQCAPPVIQSTLTAGGTSITGKCANGTSVHVIIGNNTYEATTSGSTWNVTVPAMQAGATVKVYTTSSGAIQSYFVTDKVGYSGAGTEDSPYLIYTADDLANINSYSYYKVMNDIDLTSWINANSPTAGWMPIGMSGGGTMRQLDGNGHVITGLWTNSTVDNTGLISSMENATIKDLTVVVATGKKVTGTKDYVGIVVGKSIGSTFENVTVQGDVQGRNYIASIAGYAQDGTFDHCTANGGTITSTGAYVGGITGYATGASFNLCEAKDITATSTGNYLAGIAAYTQNATFTECKVDNADISTSNGGHVGGIAGYSDNDSFEGCSVDGSSFVGTGNYVGGIAAGSETNCTFDSCMVKNTTIGGASYVGGLTGQIANSLSGFRLKGITINATGDYVGGLVGKTTASIDNCSVYADINGGDYLGGIAGNSNSSITLCQMAGNITTTKLTTCRAGGIVGYTTGNIANCFSTARTVGGQYAGGIAGYSFGKIDNCYSSGDLYATNFGGGIVGYLDGSAAVVNNCFAINNKIDVSDQNGIAMRVIGGFKNGAPTPQANNYALKTMVVSINDVTQKIYDDLLHGMSLTDDVLKQQSTYEAQGWDFNDVWGIDEGAGYPYLQAFNQEVAGVPGDVNGDGNVTVSDVVLTAQKAVGMSPDPFNEANADVNGDGNINVTDVVIIANIAVGAQAAPRRAPMLHDADMNRLTASELNIHAGESQTIMLALDNATEFTAFQMQMTLPEGLTIEQARLSDRAGSHSLLVNNADGTTRLLGFSAGNDVIEGNDGVLVEVTLKAEGNFDAYSAVKLSDMVFVETNGTAHQLDDLTLVNGIATGVEQVNANARIYGHEGHIVIEAAESGLAQIVMANGMSRTVKVAAGRNVVPMPAGMYIVKMNNAVAKIKL